MLIIARTLYVLLMFQFLLIAISLVLQSIILTKTSNLGFAIAADCLMKYQKIKLLPPKGSRNSDNMNILSFFFIFLLSFNFLRKRKNDPRLKIILIAFLVCIIYRVWKPHSKLKSCFTCQFFTHDTIEITNEVNTLHFQGKLNIFAISKFRFKDDNSFWPLLMLLWHDISLNPGHFKAFFQGLCFNRNWHRGGVACCVISDISYKLNSFLTNEIENITLDILMPHRTQSELFTDPQISLNFLIFLKKIYLNSTQVIVKFTSWVISTLIFLKMENMFSRNPPVITKT